MRQVFIVILLLTLAFFAFTSGLVSFFLIHNLIFPNLKVGGINLGTLPLRKANELLVRINEDREFVLTYEDRKAVYKFSECGLQYDVDGILRSAFSVGRQGWLKSMWEAWICLTKGLELKADIKFDKNKWENFLKKLKREVDKPPIDARPLIEGRKIMGIMPAQEGYCVDERKLFQILSEVTEPTKPLELPMKVVPPRVKEEDLKGLTLIGEFSTSLGGSSRYRLINIRKAVSAIDGTLLNPGEKFSFNEKVGPRISERGYKVAPVMVRGELVPGIGGGVCQVSTTLYNAILSAGLKVERRGHHARPVKYVAPGRDATVVWGYVDLVFSNDKNSPVYIQGEVKGGRLFFRIFGKKDFDEIKVFSNVERKPDGTIIAKTYRITKRGDENTSELISTDIYKPLPKKQVIYSKPHQINEVNDD